MSDRITTSVIIPTYNGGNRILATLEPLLNQSAPPDEIIIVIDGSTDGTEEKLNKINFLSNLIILKQANKGRAAARNKGILKASGELLILIDDDIIVDNNFIENHVNLHKNHPNSICSGQVTQLIFDNQYKDFYLYRQHLEKKWLAAYPSNKVFTPEFTIGSAQLSIEKKIMDKIGHFNNKLQDSEDFDFGVRAKEHAIEAYFDPTIIVYHADSADIKKYIHRQIEYILARKQLAKLHPEYIEKYPNDFKRIKHSLKSIIRLFFIFNPLWETILLSKLFKENIPSKYRYKLYELITSSTVYFKTF